jgi:hypothetical protein
VVVEDAVAPVRGDEDELAGLQHALQAGRQGCTMREEPRYSDL